MTQPPAGSRRPSSSTIIAVVLITTLLVVVIVAALTVFQLPDPVTAEGKRTNNLYYAVLAISFTVFLIVTSGIIWALFRFRRRGPEIPAQIHGSSVLEVTWTAIPVMILVGLFIPSVILLLDLKTPPSDDEIALRVDVIGHQWWWEFDYTEYGFRVQATPPNYANLEPPRLVVPVGQTVSLRVLSTDVVHSFSAPQTLYKIQAIPGNVNLMHFKVEEAGTYTGQCYQFCGLRHSDMLFILEAMEPDDFERWVQEQQAQSPTAPASAPALSTAGSN